MNLQPVLLSLHLNLLQSAGVKDTTTALVSCFSQVLGTQLGSSSLQAKHFFIAEPSPQPMSEHVSKSQPCISFTPSTFISFNTTSHFTIHMCHILFTTTSHFTYAAFYLSARLLTGAYLYLWTTGNDVAVDIGLQKWFIQEHMLQ